MFVDKVTSHGSSDFVPPAERIAVFDNDGTLWVEQPMYTELTFVFDRVKTLSAQHPDWKTTQPYQAVLEGDAKTLLAGGMKSISHLIVLTHSGMTVPQFELTVSGWLKTAKHPRFHRPFTQCVYQPMLELMSYLRANQFKTFIVSGGTANFMRPFTQAVYGIPSEQVIGTTFKTKYEVNDGTPQLVIEPAIDLVDDGFGKPVGIGRFIGRRPLMAFGNSDGDYEMLQYTTAGKGLRFGMFIHHSDAEREYAYDRDSHVGRLNRGLDDAAKHGWQIVDMKADWKVVFPRAKR